MWISSGRLVMNRANPFALKQGPLSGDETGGMELSGVVGRVQCPGTGAAPGKRVVGRPLVTDGLRARRCSWPPLRPARVCCEHVSVFVALPADASLSVESMGGGG